MKIGFITGAYKPAPGGVTTSVVNFARNLEQLGQEVHIFCPRYPRGSNDSEGEKVHRISSFKIPLIPDYQITNPLKAKKVFQSTLSHFDLLHIHLPTLMSSPARSVAEQSNIPFFVTYHTHLELYLRHYLPFLTPGLSRALTQHYVRRETKGSEMIFAPSRDIATVLDSYNLSSPIRTLPTGIELTLFQTPSPGIRERHNIDKGKRMLLYVGRIGSEKNLIFLLDAFELINKRLPGTELVMVGEGRGMEEIKSRAKRSSCSSHIHFAGYISDQQLVANYYRAADVFVFTSKTETQGLVIAEALAAQTPVVAIDGPGVRDLLQSGQGGYIVPESRSSFAEKVIQLLEDNHLMNQKKLEARKVAKNFSARNQARELLEYYQTRLS